MSTPTRLAPVWSARASTAASAASSASPTALPSAAHAPVRAPAPGKLSWAGVASGAATATATASTASSSAFAASSSASSSRQQQRAEPEASVRVAAAPAALATTKRPTAIATAPSAASAAAAAIAPAPKQSTSIGPATANTKSAPVSWARRVAAAAGVPVTAVVAAPVPPAVSPIVSPAAAVAVSVPRTVAAPATAAAAGQRAGAAGGVAANKPLASAKSSATAGAAAVGLRGTLQWSLSASDAAPFPMVLIDLVVGYAQSVYCLDLACGETVDLLTGEWLTHDGAAIPYRVHMTRLRGPIDCDHCDPDTGVWNGRPWEYESDTYDETVSGPIYWFPGWVTRRRAMPQPDAVPERASPHDHDLRYAIAVPSATSGNPHTRGFFAVALPDSTTVDLWSCGGVTLSAQQASAQGLPARPRTYPPLTLVRSIPKRVGHDRVYRAVDGYTDPDQYSPPAPPDSQQPVLVHYCARRAAPAAAAATGGADAGAKSGSSSSSSSSSSASSGNGGAAGGDGDDWLIYDTRCYDNGSASGKAVGEFTLCVVRWSDGTPLARLHAPPVPEYRDLQTYQAITVCSFPRDRAPLFHGYDGDVTGADILSALALGLDFGGDPLTLSLDGGVRDYRARPPPLTYTMRATPAATVAAATAAASPAAAAALAAAGGLPAAAAALPPNGTVPLWPDLVIAATQNYIRIWALSGPDSFRRLAQLYAHATITRLQHVPDSAYVLVRTGGAPRLARIVPPGYQRDTQLTRAVATLHAHHTRLSAAPDSADRTRTLQRCDAGLNAVYALRGTVRDPSQRAAPGADVATVCGPVEGASPVALLGSRPGFGPHRGLTRKSVTDVAALAARVARTDAWWGFELASPHLTSHWVDAHVLLVPPAPPAPLPSSASASSTAAAADAAGGWSKARGERDSKSVAAAAATSASSAEATGCIAALEWDVPSPHPTPAGWFRIPAHRRARLCVYGPANGFRAPLGSGVSDGAGSGAAAVAPFRITPVGQLDPNVHGREFTRGDGIVLPTAACLGLTMHTDAVRAAWRSEFPWTSHSVTPVPGTTLVAVRGVLDAAYAERYGADGEPAPAEPLPCAGSAQQSRWERRQHDRDDYLPGFIDDEAKARRVVHGYGPGHEFVQAVFDVRTGTRVSVIGGMSHVPVWVPLNQ